MDLRQYTQPDIFGKRVFLRLDLDVEVNEQGQVDDWHDLRLERAAGTIKELLDFGATQIILGGHRGRPRGKRDLNLSLMPVKYKLEILLARSGVKESIDFIENLSGNSESKLVLLENLRFNGGEQENSSELAKLLSAWGDIYVNDAFGVSHRAEASLVAITKVMPASFAGPNVIREIRELSSFIKGAPQPLLAILAGVKISTKLPLIKYLLNVADSILLGGGLANTMLASQGLEIGQSVIEPESILEAKKIFCGEILLPEDVVIRNQANKIVVTAANNVGQDDFILDIGPETTKKFLQKIKEAKSILWNGPLGKFEDKEGREATEVLAAAIAKSNTENLVGGGDTVVAVEEMGLTSEFGFVSVGGGAMLTFLAGETLPALDALLK